MIPTARIRARWRERFRAWLRGLAVVAAARRAIAEYRKQRRRDPQCRGIYCDTCDAIEARYLKRQLD